MKKILICFIATIFIMSLYQSCKKPDAIFKEFIVPGGTAYTGKANGAIAQPGNKKIRLVWARGADPKVVKAVINWDNGARSLDVVYPETGDSISVIIPDLAEKAYFFVITTYDGKGNTSIPVEIQTKVYGDTYQSSLINRDVAESNLNLAGDSIIITWGNADISNGAKATEVKFTNEAGTTVIKRFPITDAISKIGKIKSGSSYQYRTVYLPDTVGIDAFFTNYSDIQSLKLNRSLFRSIGPLPGEVVPVTPASMVWDGRFDFDAYIVDRPNKFPSWFTFDLGVTAIITNLKLFSVGEHAYKDGGVKSFEVWGSASPPNLNGSYDGFVKLGTFNANKPSGSGAVTDQDINYATRLGDDFKFDGGLPAVRYIRFKTLANYGTDGLIVLSELYIYGQPQP